jgi:hypothetical protein
MELRARTGVTPITNWRFRFLEQLGQYLLLTYLQYFTFLFFPITGMPVIALLLNRYDLYWAMSGTFYRYRDGGFINVHTTVLFRIVQLSPQAVPGP